MHLLKTLAAGLMSVWLALAPARAETIRWGAGTDVTTLDPHTFFSGSNMALLHQMHETLVRRAPDASLAPALALSWKMLDSDPQVWEFKLRPGVTFHDGSPSRRTMWCSRWNARAGSSRKSARCWQRWTFRPGHSRARCGAAEKRSQDPSQ